MGSKKTLVIGASEKPERYSNMAILALRRHHHDVVAIGNREGKVLDIAFSKSRIPYSNIDTVTLYIGPAHQPEYYDYILSLQPRRIIFNPGTENEEFQKLAEKNNIHCMEACTLVLLSTGQY